MLCAIKYDDYLPSIKIFLFFKKQTKLVVLEPYENNYHFNLFIDSCLPYSNEHPELGRHSNKSIVAFHGGDLSDQGKVHFSLIR